MIMPAPKRSLKSSTSPEMTKPWKLILLLVGIFIAGGVTGGFMVVQFGRELIINRLQSDQWAAIHLKKLSEKLDLKPEQAEQILPIIRRNKDDLNQARAECQVQMKAVFERMEREITELLTPEQRPKYEKLIKEMRERAKKGRPSGPGEPPRGKDGKPEGAPPPPSGPPLPPPAPPPAPTAPGNRV